MTSMKLRWISLLFLFLWGNYAQAQCEVSYKRQIVNQMTSRLYEEARETLNIWRHSAKEPISQALYEAYILAAEAEQEDAETQKLRKETLGLLTPLMKAVNKVDTRKFPSSMQLDIGLSFALAASIHAKNQEWVETYKRSTQGNEYLTLALEQSPEMIDAYLPLGLFQYLLANIPDGWQWVTGVLKVKGDEKMGIEWIEHAVQHSPDLAPEAARILMTEVEVDNTSACRYSELARQVLDQYPSNKTLVLAGEIIKTQCSIATLEGQTLSPNAQILTMHPGCQ